MIEIYPCIKKLHYISNEMQTIVPFKEEHSGEKKVFWNLTGQVKNESSVTIKMYDMFKLLILSELLQHNL